MVATEIGEGGGLNGEPFGAVLRQAVARRFTAGVSNSLALQSGHVGEVGEDVRGSQSRRRMFFACSNSQCSYRSGCNLRHPTQSHHPLPFGVVAVGAGADADIYCNTVEV